MKNRITVNFSKMNIIPKGINRIFHIAIILSILLLVSCNNDTEPIEPLVETTEITSFSFLKENNPSLEFDINLNIEDNLISGRVPYNGDIKNFVATFEHTGSEVYIDDISQTSGYNINDFSKIITYIVKAADGREEEYDLLATYFTGLPIVHINTNGVAIDSKEEYREGNVSVYGGHDFSDINITDMNIRGRGNSTWFIHPKKPYQLKFSDKTEMLEMPQDKKWIFLAEYSDKTMIRNSITFELGYISKLDWTPQSVFAEVFVNNEYNGTYNISQKVEESDNRVMLGDTGYLLEIDQLDRLDPDDVYFYTGDFLINIKEPELSLNSPEYNYVKHLINEFEFVLNSDLFTDPVVGYERYIDVDSFIDWYLISEITKNQDSKRFSSIFLNVIPGEKIKMGPLWDFDLAFGNVNYSECEYPTGFWVKDHAWYSRLFEDDSFVAKVKTRFSYFRENQEFILNRMDSIANHLKWAQQENDNKWNTIGIYVWPNPVVFNSYDAELEHLKSWYIDRMNWLESAYNDL